MKGSMSHTISALQDQGGWTPSKHGVTKNKGLIVIFSRRNFLRISVFHIDLSIVEMKDKGPFTVTYIFPIKSCTRVSFVYDFATNSRETQQLLNLKCTISCERRLKTGKAVIVPAGLSPLDNHLFRNLNLTEYE